MPNIRSLKRNDVAGFQLSISAFFSIEWNANIRVTYVFRARNHGEFECRAALRVFDATHSCMWRGPFTWTTTSSFICVTRSSHMRYVIHSCSWRELVLVFNLSVLLTSWIFVSAFKHAHAHNYVCRTHDTCIHTARCAKSRAEPSSMTEILRAAVLAGMGAVRAVTTLSTKNRTMVIASARANAAIWGSYCAHAGQILRTGESRRSECTEQEKSTSSLPPVCMHTGRKDIPLRTHPRPKSSREITLVRKLAHGIFLSQNYCPK